MKKVILGLLVCLSLGSCARWSNRVDANGGVFGSYTGNWIVITYSGNHITDVYKMQDVMVQSEEGSDGWLFVTEGNAVHVGGNTKAIRVDNEDAAKWNEYVEYHSEFTDLDYHAYRKELEQPDYELKKIKR